MRSAGAGGRVCGRVRRPGDKASFIAWGGGRDAGWGGRGEQGQRRRGKRRWRTEPMSRRAARLLGEPGTQHFGEARDVRMISLHLSLRQRARLPVPQHTSRQTSDETECCLLARSSQTESGGAGQWKRDWWQGADDVPRQIRRREDGVACRCACLAPVRRLRGWARGAREAAAARTERRCPSARTACALRAT